MLLRRMPCIGLSLNSYVTFLPLRMIMVLTIGTSFCMTNYLLIRMILEQLLLNDITI